jgi:hypothetical protein
VTGVRNFDDIAVDLTAKREACKHDWVRGEEEDWCLACGISWPDAMRGFGSNVQQLSGKVKRVVRA